MGSNVIILRYGEIHLKGKNRSVFENRLIENIKDSLKGLKFKINRLRARYVIEDYDDEETIVQRLKYVFGLHSFSVARKVNADPKAIKKAALELSRDNGTFKVAVNRADKKFYMNSMEFAAEVGAYILDSKPNLKVSLNNPDFIVNIDIRENGQAFVFGDYIAGAGGMPVGSAGRGLLLLSGGIDSPVAGYLCARRGLKITALHFYSFPYTGEAAKDKVIRLASILGGYNGQFNLIVSPFTKIQVMIHRLNSEYTVTLMRRYMMRIASQIAKKYNCQAIITGESLGQVASQTVESLNILDRTVDDLILRPLAGFDKEDIISISRKIGTYNTSILPYDDCCTVFVPRHPVIKPTMERVQYYERLLENQDILSLVDEAVQNCEIIPITPEYID